MTDSVTLIPQNSLYSSNFQAIPQNSGKFQLIEFDYSKAIDLCFAITISLCKVV